MTGVKWEDCLMKIHDVQTIEDFWSVYGCIEAVSTFSTGCDYSLFKVSRYLLTRLNVCYFILILLKACPLHINLLVVEILNEVVLTHEGWILNSKPVKKFI